MLLEESIIASCNGWPDDFVGKAYTVVKVSEDEHEVVILNAVFLEY